MKKTLLFISACISLVGCKKDISCSSDDTQKLVKQKLLSTVHDAALSGSNQSSEKDDQSTYNWIESHISLAITNIATVSENKDTGARSCSAQLNIQFNNVAQKSSYAYLSKDNQLMSDFINNNVISDNKISYKSPNLLRNVSYNTIMTDDNKTQLLTISDIGELPTIIGIMSVLNTTSLANLSPSQIQKYLGLISSKSLVSAALDDSNNNDHPHTDNKATTTTSIVGTIVSTHDEVGGGYGIKDNNTVYSICYLFDDNKEILDQLSNIVDKQVTVTVAGTLTDKYSFDCNSVSVSQN